MKCEGHCSRTKFRGFSQVGDFSTVCIMIDVETITDYTPTICGFLRPQQGGLVQNIGQAMT